jgi:hypothetical protein
MGVIMTTVDQRILQLWKQGWTSGDIAGQLNLTRNAVMGKLYRFRQAGVIDYKTKKARDAAITVMARTKNRNKQIAEGAELDTIEPEMPLLDWVEATYEPPKPKERKPAALFDLSYDSCRYSVSGDSAKDFLFCNKPQRQSSPYCDEHHAICYTKHTDKEKIKDRKYEKPGHIR